MKTTKVEGQAATVNSGQVSLTKAQASVRMHGLKAVGKTNRDGNPNFDKDGRAVFDVTAPIQFKIGEEFGFSGDLNKAGQMRDRDAEEIAKLEAVDRAVAECRAALQGEYEARLAASKAAADKAMETLAAEHADATAKAVESAVAAERAGFAEATAKAVEQALTAERAK